MTGTDTQPDMYLDFSRCLLTMRANDSSANPEHLSAARMMLFA